MDEQNHSLIPRPIRRKRDNPRPFWQRALFGFIEALQIFGVAGGAAASKPPARVTPLSQRVRMHETASASSGVRRTSPFVRIEERMIPPAPEPDTAQEKESGSVRYQVKRGDSLWKIAEAEYGSGMRWTDIWNANRVEIREPNLIYSGQSISVPVEETRGILIKKADGPLAQKTGIRVSPAFGSLRVRVAKQSAALASSLDNVKTEVNQISVDEKSASQEAAKKELNALVAKAHELASASSTAETRIALIDTVADILGVERDALKLANNLHQGGSAATAPSAPASLSTYPSSNAPRTSTDDRISAPGGSTDFDERTGLYRSTGTEYPPTAAGARVSIEDVPGYSTAFAGLNDFALSYVTGNAVRANPVQTPQQMAKEITAAAITMIATASTTPRTANAAKIPHDPALAQRASELARTSFEKTKKHLAAGEIKEAVNQSAESVVAAIAAGAAAPSSPEAAKAISSATQAVEAVKGADPISLANAVKSLLPEGDAGAGFQGAPPGMSLTELNPVLAAEIANAINSPFGIIARVLSPAFLSVPLTIVAGEIRQSLTAQGLNPATGLPSPAADAGQGMTGENADPTGKSVTGTVQGEAGNAGAVTVEGPTQGGAVGATPSGSEVVMPAGLGVENQDVIGRTPGGQEVTILGIQTPPAPLNEDPGQRASASAEMRRSSKAKASKEAASILGVHVVTPHSVPSVEVLADAAAKAASHAAGRAEILASDVVARAAEKIAIAAAHPTSETTRAVSEEAKILLMTINSATRAMTDARIAAEAIGSNTPVGEAALKAADALEETIVGAKIVGAAIAIVGNAADDGNMTIEALIASANAQTSAQIARADAMRSLTAATEAADAAASLQAAVVGAPTVSSAVGDVGLGETATDIGNAAVEGIVDAATGGKTTPVSETVSPVMAPVFVSAVNTGKEVALTGTPASMTPELSSSDLSTASGGTSAVSSALVASYIKGFDQSDQTKIAQLMQTMVHTALVSNPQTYLINTTEGNMLYPFFSEASYANKSILAQAAVDALVNYHLLTGNPAFSDALDQVSEVAEDNGLQFVVPTLENASLTPQLAQAVTNQAITLSQAKELQAFSNASKIGQADLEVAVTSLGFAGIAISAAEANMTIAQSLGLDTSSVGFGNLSMSQLRDIALTFGIVNPTAQQLSNLSAVKNTIDLKNFATANHPVTVSLPVVKVAVSGSTVATGGATSGNTPGLTGSVDSSTGAPAGIGDATGIASAVGDAGLGETVTDIGNAAAEGIATGSGGTSSSGAPASTSSPTPSMNLATTPAGFAVLSVINAIGKGNESGIPSDTGLNLTIETLDPTIDLSQTANLVADVAPSLRPASEAAAQNASNPALAGGTAMGNSMSVATASGVVGTVGIMSFGAAQQSAMTVTLSNGVTASFGANAGTLTSQGLTNSEANQAIALALQSTQDALAQAALNPKVDENINPQPKISFDNPDPTPTAQSDEDMGLVDEGIGMTSDSSMSDTGLTPADVDTAATAEGGPTGGAPGPGETGAVDSSTGAPAGIGDATGTTGVSGETGAPGVDAPGTDSGGNAPSGPTGSAATGEGDGGGPGSGPSGGPSGDAGDGGSGGSGGGGGGGGDGGAGAAGGEP